MLNRAVHTSTVRKQSTIDIVPDLCGRHNQSDVQSRAARKRDRGPAQRTPGTEGEPGPQQQGARKRPMLKVRAKLAIVLRQNGGGETLHDTSTQVAGIGLGELSAEQTLWFLPSSCM